MTRSGYNVLAILLGACAAVVAVASILTGDTASDTTLLAGPFITGALTLAGRGERA